MNATNYKKNLSGFILVILTIALISCGSSKFNFETPPPWPIYSNNVYNQSTNIGKLLTRSTKTISFTTTDKPNQIFNFYEEVLANSAWRLVTTSDTKIFFTTPKSCPFHFLSVEISSITSEETNVIIQQESTGCY